MTSCHEVKYYKTALRMCGSLRAFDSFTCIGAGTTRVGNSGTCTCSMQYQFRAGWALDN